MADWTECMDHYFTAFRKPQLPTFYGPNKTPVTSDVLLVGFGYAILSLVISFLVVLIPLLTLCKKELAFSALRIFTALYITSCIMLCNFGQEWEVAKIYSRTPYKAYISKTIKAHIGVKIGLRSVNITLKGDPVTQQLTEWSNETINYNERFSWDNQGWTLGLQGFGPMAGRFNKEYRKAQWKGLPLPILWIAEYFTIDGEHFRWGRLYQQAGYFTHILLWLALPVWWLSCILFHMVLIYGVFFMTLTGALLLLSNIIYSSIRNPHSLVIPFEDEKLEFHWGWCWWLTLVNGLIVFIGGVAVLILTQKRMDLVELIFGHDPTKDLEEVYGTLGDLNLIYNKSGTIGRKFRSIPRRLTCRGDVYETVELDRNESIPNGNTPTSPSTSYEHTPQAISVAIHNGIHLGEDLNAVYGTRIANANGELVHGTATNGAAPKATVTKLHDRTIYENHEPVYRMLRKRMQTLDIRDKFKQTHTDIENAILVHSDEHIYDNVVRKSRKRNKLEIFNEEATEAIEGTSSNQTRPVIEAVETRPDLSKPEKKPHISPIAEEGETSFTRRHREELKAKLKQKPVPAKRSYNNSSAATPR